MWIRSQNKEKLVNVSNVYIYEETFGKVWQIKTIDVKDLTLTVAKYSTKEKALKVLEMIHSFIIEWDGEGVFQMPTEEETELKL